MKILLENLTQVVSQSGVKHGLWNKYLQSDLEKTRVLFFRRGTVGLTSSPLNKTDLEWVGSKFLKNPDCLVMKSKNERNAIRCCYISTKVGRGGHLKYLIQHA